MPTCPILSGLSAGTLLTLPSHTKRRRRIADGALRGRCDGRPERVVDMGASELAPAVPLAAAFLPGLMAFQTAIIFLSAASALSLAIAAGASRRVRSVCARTRH